MVDFFRKFGFTKRDLTLIAFLSLSFLIGLIIKVAGWHTSPVYDYTAANKEYEDHLSQTFSRFELNASEREKANNMRNYYDSLLDAKEKNTTLKNGEIPDKKININTALSGDLQLLPGIGQVTAERIIDYREQKGEFKSTDDIMSVKGIGPKKFEKIKNLITVN